MYVYIYKIYVPVNFYWYEDFFCQRSTIEGVTEIRVLIDFEIWIVAKSKEITSLFIFSTFSLNFFKKNYFLPTAINWGYNLEN